MARSAPKSAPATGRPAVSHRSIFDALKIEGEDSASESEDEVAPTPALSKKAAKQQQQQQQQQQQASVAEQASAAVGSAVEVAQEAVETVKETVVPLTRRAEKKLARQAALKAAALAGTEASPSSSSSSDDAGGPSPPPGKIYINVGKDSHLDPPVAALAASTPEVEALKEMGVENDGSGPAAGAEPTAESKDITGQDQLAVKEAREVKIDRGQLDEQRPAASKQQQPQRASASTNGGKGGLAHPFSPSNLPSLPHLPDPKKSVPSKRGAAADFAGSDKKEKKVVRFDGSEVADAQSTAGLSREEKVQAKTQGLSEAELAKQKRMKDAGTRTASTFAMIAGFFGASRIRSSPSLALR
jgi:hypothetical protein